MNVLELGFEGGALIWGKANGDADVNLSLLVVTAAQGLPWFVLSLLCNSSFQSVESIQ